MKSFFGWLMGLFAPGNRKTTLAGLATLAGTAASCAGMASGAPITPGSIGIALTGLSAGVGLLAAKDSNGTVTPPAVAQTVAAIAQLGTVATSADELYAPLKASIEAAGKQASDAAKVQAIANAVQQIAATAP